MSVAGDGGSRPSREQPTPFPGAALGEAPLVETPASGAAPQGTHVDHASAQGDNVTYVDGAVLHPGNSFTPPLAGASVQVLPLRISAPWMKPAEAIDHHRAVDRTGGDTLWHRRGAALGPVADPPATV